MGGADPKQCPIIVNFGVLFKNVIMDDWQQVQTTLPITAEHLGISELAETWEYDK